MNLSIRLLGILLAAAIALVTALVVQAIPALGWTYFDVGPYTPFAVYPILVASLAAALVVPRLGEGSRHAVVEVLAMAIATYLIAILLFPIVMAVTGGTTVSDDGGACVSMIGCRLGGDAALQAYALTPIAILFLLPSLLVLLVPSAVWVFSMRRLVLDDSWTDPYQRS
ncbi:MAG TPA: hypothetical protein VF337_11085 [Candidatus Limnocylindrales bacterium]